MAFMKKEKSTTILDSIAPICRRVVYITGLFSFVVNILMLSTVLYMLNLYDRVLASYSFDTLLYLTLITLFCLVILSILDALRSRILLDLGVWFENTVSPEALLKSPDLVIKGERFSSFILRDIANIRQFINASGIGVLLDIPWIIIYVIFLFILHPLLGVYSVVGGLIIFFIAYLNEKTTHDLLVESNTNTLLANNYIETSLRNAEIIQAMGMMPGVISHWNEKNKLAQEAQILANYRNGFLMGLSKCLRLILQTMILGVGAYLVLEHKLSSGGMIAGSILLGRALMPIDQSIAAWKPLLRALESFKTLKKHFSSEGRRVIDISLPRPQGHVSVEKLSYKMEQMEYPILTDINFTLPPGKLLAVIGATGSGKTTLARLITGALPPTIGHARLDGADVYSWKREEVGRYIGYLPQDIEWFSGTIKENIARLGEVNDEAVIEAAQIAGVHDLILRLGLSYDSYISSGAKNFSGGQLQRIALARAIYGSPSLIILDEPNSNLDIEGEQFLTQAIGKLKEKGSTQIIITHKPMILQHVDFILVMHQGRMVMLGPRDDVLKKLQLNQ